MRKFADDRSRAYNDLFPQIGKGDVNVGVLYPGTIKAFHRHQLQDDYWFIAKGHIRAVLYTGDLYYTVPINGQWTSWGTPCFDGFSPIVSNSTAATKSTPFVEPSKLSVHYLSEGDMLHIPAGVWHGLQVLGNEEAVLIYHITKKYNAETPDEERAPWDTFHDWSISKK